jgi:hypothetical protein
MSVSFASSLKKNSKIIKSSSSFKKNGFDVFVKGGQKYEDVFLKGKIAISVKNSPSQSYA